MTLRVLVCGGRDYTDKSRVYQELYDLAEPTDEHPLGSVSLTIITGACPTGADSFAADWAVTNWCRLLEFPADWKTYGRAAGPIRNRKMLTDGCPDLVIAFPGGRGTADMVARAKSAGVSVRELTS